MSGPARPSLFVTDFPRGTQKPFSSPSDIFSADGEVCVHQCRATSIPDPGLPRVTSNTWVVIGGRRLATVDIAGFSFSVTSADELSVEDPKFWFVLSSVGLVAFSTCMVSLSVIAEPKGHQIYSYLNTEVSDGKKFLFIIWHLQMQRGVSERWREMHTWQLWVHRHELCKAQLCDFLLLCSCILQLHNRAVPKTCLWQQNARGKYRNVRNNQHTYSFYYQLNNSYLQEDTFKIHDSVFPPYTWTYWILEGHE